MTTLNVEKTLKKIEDIYGEVPFILREISRDEKDFVTSVQKLFHLMGSSKVFSPKETELFAIAGAVGNNGNHCLAFHLRQAIKFGATEEELFQVILIAALMSESSSLAIGLRKLKEAQK
ncbi:MAG: carboxymuconolactone decarboxylase family protein [Candidatus Methanofastidiosa archaeon]|jgi:AhpD family alkylhydroperoxidase|nr:carboxymuconolactone decarboxylase family protein [Candidatus Methanofastidiosa archaeon]